ncbi:MAG: hypothetical protein EBY74_06405 [Actinobacteria bacterium]|nr:hypothetical protein [Actinomycetota bacterium]
MVNLWCTWISCWCIPGISAGPVQLGGLLLGLFMELSQLDIFFGGVPSNYKPVVAFAALVLVLLFKPEGLFGYRSRKV